MRHRVHNDDMGAMTAKTEQYTYDNNPYLSVPSFSSSEEPFDLTEMVNQASNLELEIGFGRGRFIRERARLVPDTRILGIETKRKMVYLCAQKAQAAQLDNVCVIHGDARDILTRIRVDDCFRNVFVNFPDPWWKARHQKRKVITSSMVSHLARLLRPEGGLFVQTDVDFRGREFSDVLAAHPCLTPGPGADSRGRVDKNPFGAVSSRERRAMDIGMEVYRLLFVRKR